MRPDTGSSECVARGTEYERVVAAWKHERPTTIVLEERAGGTWHATQRGVDVHGYGDTAAAAAAAYCSRVDGR